MWALAFLAIALMIGAAVQAVCVRRDRRRLRPVGRLVDAWHVIEAGADGPPVLFEAGLAATSLNWSVLQRELAAGARTVSYDRAGLGWSEDADARRETSRPAPHARSLQRWVDDLHHLIRALRLPLPLVLVGHSFGTLIVRGYAHRFPADVAGLVLLDPVVADEFSRPGWRTRVRLWRAWFFAHVAAVLAAFGLARLGLWGLLRRGAGNPGPLLGLSGTLRRLAAELAKLPAPVVQVLQARWSEPRFFRQLAAAIRALPGCAADAERLSVPADVPVVVFSGAHHAPVTLDAHARLATRHVVVDGSAHWVHLDQPSLVARVILDIPYVPPPSPR